MYVCVSVYTTSTTSKVVVMLLLSRGRGDVNPSVYTKWPRRVCSDWRGRTDRGGRIYDL